MTNLSATPAWDDVPAWEITTSAFGPTMNAPAQALLNRTEKLKNDIEAANDKLADVPSVLDFHDQALHGNDHTAAFIAAGALAGREVVIPWRMAGYDVTGTIPVHCRFRGLGNPTINLTVNGGADQNSDRGFWLKSGGGIKGVRIVRTVMAGSISGDFNNAILIGNYFDPTGTDYANVDVEDVELVGAQGIGRRNIFFIGGNVHDCTIKKLRISGYVSYGMMLHWGGAFDAAAPGTSPVTASWHPRRITIEDVFVDSLQPDAGLGGILLSACHDITVRNLVTKNCRVPFAVAAGDVGGLVAQGESKNAVMKNLRFENVSADNFDTAGFQMYGRSGDRAGAVWYACDNDVSVVVDGVSFERGSLSANARALDIWFMQNVEVTGMSVSHIDNGFQDILTPAVFIQACNNIKVRGSTHVPFAHEVVGSTNIRLDTSDKCLRSDYNASCIGTRVTGQTGAHVLAAPLALNATSIQLTTLAFDVIAGSTITVGGQTMTITAAQIESTGPVTLAITPSPVAAASGAAATVAKALSSIKLLGSADRFHTGAYLINTNSGAAKSVTITKDFTRSGLHDIYGRAARALKIRGCTFREGGQTDTTNGNNIRLIDACTDVDIEGNTFEDNPNAATKVRYCIYLFSNTVGGRIRGNSFHAAQVAAINQFQPTGSERHPQIGQNWFGPLVATPITPTNVAQVVTIGDRQMGYGTAAPNYGAWKAGDMIFNVAPTAGGKAGWVCVAAGAPGTWKAFGAIDA